MSFKEKLAGILGISSTEVEEEGRAVFGNPEKIAQLEAANAAKDAEIAALKQGQSSQFAAQSATTAQGEAERLFREGKLTPAERESFVTAFSAAITADGGVKFGADSKTEFGAVASAILKAYDARQPMPVFGSQIHIIPGSDAGGDAQFGRKEVAESIDALNAGGKS